MTTVRIQGYIISTTDVTNRYMTIELKEISADWDEWEHRILLTKGTTGLVYDRMENVEPGKYPVYLGITVLYSNVYWEVNIKITRVDTGATLFEKKISIGDWTTVKHVGDVDVPKGLNVTTDGGGGGGGGGGIPDISVIINEMMEKMMPVMINMMGMMMMINMMSGMMTEMAGAF